METDSELDLRRAGTGDPLLQYVYLDKRLLRPQNTASDNYSPAFTAAKMVLPDTSILVAITQRPLGFFLFVCSFVFCM